MIKIYSSSILFFCLFQFLYSQEITEEIENQEKQEKQIFDILYEENDSCGLINIYQDIRIEDLVLQHIEQNKKQTGIPGYRINIYFESGLSARQQAMALRDTFNVYFSEIPSYLEYQTPNFKVYVGDFRTKAEALKFYKIIRRRYPKAFIVNDQINYPRIVQ